VRSNKRACVYIYSQYRIARITTERMVNVQALCPDFEEQSSDVEEQSLGPGSDFVMVNPEGRKGRKGRRQYRLPNICEWPWFLGFGPGETETPRSVLSKLGRVGGMPNHKCRFQKMMLEMEVKKYKAMKKQKAADARHAAHEERDRKEELRIALRDEEQAAKDEIEALEQAKYDELYRNAPRGEKKTMKLQREVQPRNILEGKGGHSIRANRKTVNYGDFENEEPRPGLDLDSDEYDAWAAEHTCAGRRDGEYDDDAPDLGNAHEVYDDHIHKPKRSKSKVEVGMETFAAAMKVAMKVLNTSQIVKAMESAGINKSRKRKVSELEKGRNVLELIQTLIPLLTSDHQSQIFSEY
jgi:hypothetical protein